MSKYQGVVPGWFPRKQTVWRIFAGRSLFTEDQNLWESEEDWAEGEAESQ